MIKHSVNTVFLLRKTFLVSLYAYTTVKYDDDDYSDDDAIFISSDSYCSDFMLESPSGNTHGSIYPYLHVSKKLLL